MSPKYDGEASRLRKEMQFKSTGSLLKLEEAMLQLKSEGSLLSKFFMLGRIQPFVLCRPSTDWMRSTHIMESYLLYSRPLI